MKADVPLIEKSMQFGFSGQSQFMSAFRKLVAMTPDASAHQLTASQSLFLLRGHPLSIA
jgi:AraC family transcriptional regulator